MAPVFGDGTPDTDSTLSSCPSRYKRKVSPACVTATWVHTPSVSDPTLWSIPIFVSVELLVRACNFAVSGQTHSPNTRSLSVSPLWLIIRQAVDGPAVGFNQNATLNCPVPPPRSMVGACMANIPSVGALMATPG